MFEWTYTKYTVTNWFRRKIEVEIYDEIVDLLKSRTWRFFIWILSTPTIVLLWAVMAEKVVFIHHASYIWT